MSDKGFAFGRLETLKRLNDYHVLNIPEWDEAKNEQYLQHAMDSNQAIHVFFKSGFDDDLKTICIYARELNTFFNRGYFLSNKEWVDGDIVKYTLTTCKADQYEQDTAILKSILRELDKDFIAGS